MNLLRQVEGKRRAFREFWSCCTAACPKHAPHERRSRRLLAATAAAEDTAVATFDQDFRKFADVRVETH